MTSAPSSLTGRDRSRDNRRPDRIPHHRDRIAPSLHALHPGNGRACRHAHRWFGLLGPRRFPPLQQHRQSCWHRNRLQGCRGLDHRGLVERCRAVLRNAAARSAGCALLLHLRGRLRPRRRMVRTRFHVLTREGVHHSRHRKLPGARLSTAPAFRGRHRRAALLDGAVDRHRRAGAGQTAARRACPAPRARRCSSLRREGGKK